MGWLAAIPMISSVLGGGGKEEPKNAGPTGLPPSQSPTGMPTQQTTSLTSAFSKPK